MKKQKLIRAALEGQATLVIKNARIVNVFTNELISGDVAICEDTIIGIGSYSCDNEIDAQGGILTPGFIDAHVHIESSMVTPASFMEAIMPHGTTTIIADPHEIANVLGTEGIDILYHLSEGLPLRVLFMMPSCVPALPFENNGACLEAEDMKSYLGKDRVIGLAEVMDYVSATNGSKSMLDKLELFEGRVIDGHAPLITGRVLNAYRVAGPSTDHECSEYDEVLEKLRSGMRILLRVGSAAKGIREILHRIALEKLPTDNIMFCTDDKHIETIKKEGHIDHIVRMAVKEGISPIEAVKMASYNSARAYGLQNVGAIAPGYKADMILFEDLVDFKVKRVFTRFGMPYEEIVPELPVLPKEVSNSIHLAPVTKERLCLPVKEQMPIIQMVPEQLLTKLVYRKVRSENGCFVAGEGLNKLVVAERHHATGNVGVAIVEGMELVNGAIGSTVAHDSHNMVVLGDNDEDILQAMETLQECGGGYVVVSKGKVLAKLPLPIAGLITDAPIQEVLTEQRKLLDAAATLGVDEKTDPLLWMSFLALPVIPQVRLTDRGLFDVINMKFME